MNGLSIFEIHIHSRYGDKDFDEDLKSLLRRSGCKGEKMMFIIDESNVIDSSFLEKMNILLANSEVPGLFNDEELTALLHECRESSQKEGLIHQSPQELYQWFISRVSENLQ